MVLTRKLNTTIHEVTLEWATNWLLQSYLMDSRLQPSSNMLSQSRSMLYSLATHCLMIVAYYFLPSMRQLWSRQFVTHSKVG